VPVAEPRREYDHLADGIGEAIARVLRSGTYVQGPEHDAFEVELAAYVGAAHGVGVGNATDGLEITLRALDCGPGTEVVTVANAGGFATAAARLTGATPVHVDVDAASLLMDVDALRAALGPRTSAVVVTHLFGRIHPRLAELVELCASRSVPLVEDCAQAAGARAAGRHAGSSATAAVFSFYPTKNLGGLGDGGMVTTGDADIAGRVRALRRYGRGPLMTTELDGGRNSRLDELQAAVLRVKLRSLDDLVARRREVVAHYRRAAPEQWWAGANDASYAAHLAVTQVADRPAFRAAAAAAGVGTAVHYDALDRGAHAARLPVAAASVDRVVTLPCHPFLDGSEIARVVDLLRSGSWT
jgi:dTDP-3-amino-2,3,6-trideoxy-4-keto-D-glucose/dTDP-3-amino-3,4,6-trideoxy-alpha-D-glucose/dTDP-2,6-dideoxy-D-kanosamine transaminase